MDKFNSSPTGRDLKPKTVALDVTSSQTVRVSPRSGFAPVTRGAHAANWSGSRKLDQPLWGAVSVVKLLQILCQAQVLLKVG